MSNRLSAFWKRLVLFINCYRIRTVLIAGFAAVILLGMATVLLTQWTAYLTDRTMNRFVNVDNKISDLCLRSTTAMLNARRHEKDFLLSYRDFGFSEAKSRYISRVLTSLADIKGFMESIRLLTNNPEFVRLTEEIDKANDQYQYHLVNMIEKYGTLGSTNSGIEGAMRNKAHDMEVLLKQQENKLLFADLLQMRRREKDFIMRNRDSDVSEFRKAAVRFEADLTASGTPAERKKELRNLSSTYRMLLEQYVQTGEGIRLEKKEIRHATQTIEPTLEKLYIGSLAGVASAREDIETTKRSLWPFKAAAGLLVFIFSLVVALAVSGTIATSINQTTAFATDIASGNLSNRLIAKGRNEFVTLATALNKMAASLCAADVAQKKSLEEIEQLARFPNESIHPMMRVTKDGIVMYANKSSLPLLETWGCQIGHHLPHQWRQYITDVFTSKESKETEFEAKGRVYSLTFVPIFESDYVNIYGHDITERNTAEERLGYMAHFDTLTGLPNRLLLKDRVERAISAARRSKRKTGLLFLDIDNFKHINDSFNHSFGDLLLRAVSQRLQGVMRESDTIARIGGDEFIVLLSDIERSDAAATVARKIIETMREPFTLENRVLHTTASIGISIHPDDGSDYDTLIKNADTAMYQAKEVGRDTYQFFTQEMNDRVFERLSVEHNLRRALEREEFILHYQPQMNIETREIVGIEALIRWQHPKMGLVQPARFLHIAEDSGLIIPIGEWVLRTACRQHCDWQKAGLPAVPMAVNLAAIQFRQQNLLDTIKRAVRDTDIDPQYLELELTESAVMRNVEDATAIMQEMKAMGLKLTIDDFGTGYSSLNYLKRFPIDKLKIDQSFVRDITTDPNDAAITLAIISMAHTLGLRVIAEGVETAEQLAFLQEHGCDEIQGYYFSKPLPANEFASISWKKI
jgi:diguanylate cyclase (GGDEF)-like protein